MPYKDKSSAKHPWVGQVRINGRKIKHRCATRKEALEWEALQKSITPQEIGTVSMDEWANTYLDFCQAKFVPKTYEEKRTVFRMLFAHPGISVVMPVASLSQLILLEYFQKQAKVRSGNAANKDRKNLSAAWNWGIQYLNMPTTNPFQRIGRQGEVRHPRHITSLDEFMSVYNAASTAQDKRMLLCFLYSGARREELFRLRWLDVDFINNRIRIYWRKNMLGTWNAAWVSMTSEAMTALTEQYQDTGSGDWVFVEPGKGRPYQYRLQWLRRLCDKAGVKRFGCHGIRHLCASILAEKGVPTIDIKEHLRHEHLATTEKYVHKLKENRSVIRALSGLMSTLITESPQEAPSKVNLLS